MLSIIVVNPNLEILNSITTQTYLPAELVIVYDGKQQERVLLDGIIEHIPVIQEFIPAKIGKYNAYNIGLAITREPYALLLEKPLSSKESIAHAIGYILLDGQQEAYYCFDGTLVIISTKLKIEGYPLETPHTLIDILLAHNPTKVIRP